MIFYPQVKHPVNVPNATKVRQLSDNIYIYIYIYIYTIICFTIAAWRRGMLGVIQAMSDEKPENGWFIPNCGTDGASIFLSSDDSSGKNLAKEIRKNVRIPLFANPEEKKNVLQV